MNVLLPHKGKLNQTKFVALYIIMLWEQCIINKVIVDSGYGVLLPLKSNFFKRWEIPVYIWGKQAKQTINRDVTLINEITGVINSSVP